MRPLATFASCLMASLLLKSAAQAADPPGRVGRLSHIEGTVSYHLADQDQWSPAVLNYPVSSGTSFWTEPNARAEIQIGGANVRIDHATQLDVARLDDSGTELQVNQGTVSIQINAAAPGGLIVATPHGAATLLQPGRYRFDVSPPPGDAPPERSQITVLDGAARISQDGAADFELPAGTSATITGDPLRVERRAASATPFDDWALSREPQLTSAETPRYVSREIPGYQDLERNGRWRSVPELGPV
jgi:hypothetical protein